MHLDTLTGRIRFLLLRPVDALRYAHGTPTAELGGLKAVAVLLLLVNFAFALTLYHHGNMLDVVPSIGAALHLILVYVQRVFDLFAWGMFLYLVILRRRSQGCRPGCAASKEHAPAGSSDPNSGSASLLDGAFQRRKAGRASN